MYIYISTPLRNRQRAPQNIPSGPFLSARAPQNHHFGSLFERRAPQNRHYGSSVPPLGPPWGPKSETAVEYCRLGTKNVGFA